MFQFRRFPAYTYGFSARWQSIALPGFPIRTSTDQSPFAAPRSFSQLVASFIGSQCQGIPLAPFTAWPAVSGYLSISRIIRVISVLLAICSMILQSYPNNFQKNLKLIYFKIGITFIFPQSCCFCFRYCSVFKVQICFANLHLQPKQVLVGAKCVAIRTRVSLPILLMLFYFIKQLSV